MTNDDPDTRHVLPGCMTNDDPDTRHGVMYYPASLFTLILCSVSWKTCLADTKMTEILKHLKSKGHFNSSSNLNMTNELESDKTGCSQVYMNGTIGHQEQEDVYTQTSTDCNLHHNVYTKPTGETLYHIEYLAVPEWIFGYTTCDECAFMATADSAIFPENITANLWLESDGSIFLNYNVRITCYNIHDTVRPEQQTQANNYPTNSTDSANSTDPTNSTDPSNSTDLSQLYSSGANKGMFHLLITVNVLITAALT